MQKIPEKETPGRRQILVFCPLYPPHIGGLESHAQQWNEQMVKAGYAITVWTPHIVPTSPRREEKDGVTIIRFPAWEIISNYPVPKFWHPLFWKQWREINIALKAKSSKIKANPIIVSRTRFFLTSMMALIAAKISGAPWLHIEHGSDFVQLTSPLPRFLAWLYDHTLGNLVLRQATAVVGNSHASAQFVKHLSGRACDAVIYRGLDLQKIVEITPATKLSLPTITYVGRLISSKGVQDLVAALALLKEKQWHCWIVGAGPQRASLQKLVGSLGIRESISFLGEKPWEETIGLLKASDIVVNPSYTEGLPTSIIEAALCRKAIIATDVGGTREIIQHNQSGYLVPAHNPDALAQSIEILVKNSLLRQQMGNEAYTQATKKFDWHTAIKEYKKLCAAL